jgi:hypothetical protein
VPGEAVAVALEVQPERDPVRRRRRRQLRVHDRAFTARAQQLGGVLPGPARGEREAALGRTHYGVAGALGDDRERRPLELDPVGGRARRCGERERGRGGQRRPGD